MLFGVAAACIPTLRPLYKWFVQEYNRLTSKNSPSKPSTQQWSPPKPSKPTLPKTYGAKVDESVLREEDLLPLQEFGGADGSASVQREVRHQTEESKTNETEEFKPGLHLHGDLSTSRPGHFKRWDSEARIGGGHGVEEIEDRI